MIKQDVDAFVMLCAPLRKMSDVLVIPEDVGHNVSASYESFAPRKPPENSPDAHQMVQKNVCLIKADVDVTDKLCLCACRWRYMRANCRV